MGGNGELFALVDFATVEAMHHRAPKRNSSDRAYITCEMENGRLFPLISDLPTRAAILQRILDIDCQIPSIFTFLEDTKWLEPPAEAMKQLTTLGRSSTVRRAMLQDFERSTQINLRGKHSVFNLTSSEKVVFMAAYCSIFAFAWRHFPSLTSFKPRKQKPNKKTSWEVQSSTIRGLFFKEARSLGFDVQQPDQDTLERDMINKFIDEARPPAFFKLLVDRNTLVSSVIQLLDGKFGESSGVTTIDNLESAPSSQRSGRPYEASFLAARQDFWVENIYDSQCSINIDDFLVHRDIFRAFFGTELLSIESRIVEPVAPEGVESVAQPPESDSEDEEIGDVPMADTGPQASVIGMGAEQLGTSTSNTSGQNPEPSGDFNVSLRPAIFAFFPQMNKLERWPKASIGSKMKSLASEYLFAKLAPNNSLKYISNERAARSVDVVFVVGKQEARSLGTREHKDFVEKWWKQKRGKRVME